MKRAVPVLFLFLSVSCFNEGDCLITSTNLLKLSLFDKINGLPRSTTFLSIRQSNNGLELIKPDSTTDVLALPLDPRHNESSFVFLTGDSVTYFLTLHYETFTRVIAPDCGAFLYFQNVAIDTTNFDRIKVITPQLFTGVKENMEIYF